MASNSNPGLRKFVAPEIVFGDGALNLIGQCAASFGARRVLLVSDPGVNAAGWVSPAKKSLQEAGISCFLFDLLTPNPKDHEVMAGAQAYRYEQCDVIVAVGGGSSMDCAKAIGIVASNDRHVLEFEGVDKIVVPGPPMICVPTTAGSSADVSQFAIITDTARQVKIAIISKTLVPDVALIDPVTTVTMSPPLTAATGMDALAHAVEAYSSNASSPLTDMNALEAIRLVVHHLDGAVKEPRNMRYRHGMMLASLLAGLAFSNASLGLVHSMAHALGGLCDLPHGECNAILLEHVVRFNFSAASDCYRNVGRAMGVDIQGLSADRETLAEAFAQLRRRVGIQATLGPLGVRLADIPDLARKALHDPCLATNPTQPTSSDIETIYEQAL